ncbi:hypothetical protein OSTOST_11062 [Ostertagia ostertagi]
MDEDSDKTPAAEEEEVVKNSDEATRNEVVHFVVVNTTKLMKWVTRKLAIAAKASINVATIKVASTTIAAGCTLLAWKFRHQVLTGSLLRSTVTPAFFVYGAGHGGYYGAFGGASAAMAVHPSIPSIVAGALMGGGLGGLAGAWTAAMVVEGILHRIGKKFTL